MSDQMEPTNDISPAETARPQKLKPKVIEGGGALAAENLGKSFKRRPVVRGVSMSVKRGEVVGLLGPNGAGKTTCFYMITGLIPADRGRIMIDGHDVTNLPMYQRARLGVGYLPQEASIFRGMTVEQNLRAVVELVERNKDKQQTIIDDLLNEFHITHIRNAPAIGVLITDHNVRETLDIIDRAYIIHEGEVLLEGAPGEIVGDKDVRRVYLGDRFQM